MKVVVGIIDDHKVGVYSVGINHCLQDLKLSYSDDEGRDHRSPIG